MTSRNNERKDHPLEATSAPQDIRAFSSPLNPPVFFSKIHKRSLQNGRREYIEYVKLCHFLCKLGGLIAAAISSNDKIYAAPFIEDLFQVFMWHDCNALWIYSVDLGVQIDQSESQVLKKVQLFLFELWRREWSSAWGNKSWSSM